MVRKFRTTLLGMKRHLNDYHRDDTESVAGSITSCCNSLVTVTDRDTSDGYSADGDVSDSDSEFSLDGQRYI